MAGDGGRRSRIATTSATIALMPRPVSVALPSASSGSSPMMISGPTMATSTATIGTTSAGTKSLLPNRSARLVRSSGVVVRSLPFPTRPNPASTTITSTTMPSSHAGAWPLCTNVP